MEGINHDNRSLLLIIFFSFWSDVELILLFTEGCTYTEISTVRFSVLPAIPVQRSPKDILLLYRVFVRKTCKRVY